MKDEVSGTKSLSSLHSPVADFYVYIFAFSGYMFLFASSCLVFSSMFSISSVFEVFSANLSFAIGFLFLCFLFGSFSNLSNFHHEVVFFQTLYIGATYTLYMEDSLANSTCKNVNKLLKISNIKKSTEDKNIKIKVKESSMPTMEMKDVYILFYLFQVLNIFFFLFLLFLKISQSLTFMPSLSLLPLKLSEVVYHFCACFYCIQ